MPRKINFPPIPGTEDEQWDELAAEFGMKKEEIKKIVFPSWMFDKGFINKWGVRKMLLNKGYKQIIQPEEDDPEKTYNEWLKEHPFTKKWHETCPYFQEGNPHYEKPRKAEIINKQEKINIEDMDYPKPTRKEIEINKEHGRAGAYYSTGEDRFEETMKDPRDIYITENNRNLEREVVEEGLKKYKEKLKTEPWTLVDDQVPVGTQVNGVEVIKPQTDFNDTDQDYGCDEKQNLTLGEHILKEYAKDKKREEIKRDMSKYIMNDQEEEKIKNMLNLKEAKKDNDAVVPGDFDGICHDLMALHARKNKDYGNAADASYREFGLVSYIIRLNDKMNRLKSLTKPGVEQEVKGESIEDTLMDLAAYAIMAIESLRN